MAVALRPKLGLYFRTRRSELGLTQKDVADQAGMSYVSISRIEKGEPFSEASYQKVAEVLSLDFAAVQQILNEEEPEPAPTVVKPTQFFGRSVHCSNGTFRGENRFIQIQSLLPDTTGHFTGQIDLKLEDGTNIGIEFNELHFFDGLRPGSGSHPEAGLRPFVQGCFPSLVRPYSLRLAGTKLSVTKLELVAITQLIDQFVESVKEAYHQLKETLGCQGIPRCPNAGWRLLKIPMRWWFHARFAETESVPFSEKIEFVDGKLVVLRGATSVKRMGSFAAKWVDWNNLEPRVWVTFVPQEGIPWTVQKAQSWFLNSFLPWLIRHNPDLVESPQSGVFKRWFDVIPKIHSLGNQVEKALIPQPQTLTLQETCAECAFYFLNSSQKFFDFEADQRQRLEESVALFEPQSRDHSFFGKPKPKDSRPFYDRNLNGVHVIPKTLLNDLFSFLEQSLSETQDQNPELTTQIEKAIAPFWAYVSDQQEWERLRLEFVGPKPP